MKRHPKYKFEIENESRLEKIVSFSLSPVALWSVVAAIVVVFIFLGAVVVMITPARTLLPGYLKQSERAATEDNILRLDSVLAIYEQNREYIDNVLRVLDTDRVPTDSTALANSAQMLTADSLLPASEAERKFINAMEERERFNISVLAPLAADGMIFSPLAEGAVFTTPSRTETKGIVAIPTDEPVKNIADGSVLASYYSATEDGYVIIIQHAKGFVSRISRLSSPMVSTGDTVLAGQILSASPTPNARGQRFIEVMMWHNGLPLIPFDYIGAPDKKAEDSVPFEAPRGRL